MSQRYCCIKNCQYFSGCINDSKISFFRTPATGELRDAWLAAINKHQEVDSTFMICQLHFDEKYLRYDCSSSKPKLKLNAIPTIFPTTIGWTNQHSESMKGAPSSTNDDLEVKPVIRTYGRKTIPLNRNLDNLLNLYIKQELDEPEVIPSSNMYTEVNPSDRYAYDPLSLFSVKIKQESDEQNTEVIPLNRYSNTSRTYTKERSMPGKQNSQLCIRCMQNDVQIQRQKVKINELRAKCGDRQRSINKLKAQLARSKAKLRILDRNLTPSPTPLYKKCTICLQRYLMGENHMCDERETITCDYCEQTFISMNNLSDHLAINHTQKKIHKCDKCGQIYSMALLLSIHDRQHTANQPRLICEICDERFYTIYQIKNHMNERHSGKVTNEQTKTVNCGTCGRCFMTQGNLRSHMVNKHDKMIAPFECFICKMKLSSLHDTRKHLELNHKRDEKCTICNTELTTTELNEHICSGLENIRCIYCKKKFECIKHLLNHLEQECKHEKLMYKCYLCKKYYPMKIIRDVHMKHHTVTLTEYMCDICPKSFAQRILLLAHKKTHGARDYLCDECGKRFKLPTNLKIHKRSHGERTFQCPMCTSRFVTKNQLLSHSIVHKNNKIVCDICNASISSVKLLSKHMKKHRRTEADRKYACPICSLKFYEPFHLKKHVNVRHSTNRPFKCNSCDQAYKYAGDLVKHKHQMHDDLYTCSSCPKRFRLKKDLIKHEYEHYTPQNVSN